MAPVHRRVLANGDYYAVECAVRADGITSPVAQLLHDLRQRRWVPRDGQPAVAADEQVHLYAWFLAEIEYFAETGRLHRRGEWNQLRDGIWEFKHHDVRISFYDTDGHGHYEPKIVEREPFAGGGYFPLPEFDERIRLGTAFEKLTPKTPEHELRLARQIRQEDLAHDRD
jgi:hypothetical protein